MRDNSMGRLSVVCEVFYTFTVLDVLMYFEFQANSSKNIILKLALNKNDIELHITSNIRSILFDRVLLNRAISGFLERVSFIRTPMYMRPVVQYRRHKGTLYQYENTFRGSLVTEFWLEKVAREQKVVNQYVKRFGKFYAVLTVFKVTNIDGFEVEVYFPKGQKRFIFQMFNEELMLIDMNTIQRLYEVSSEEIRVLAEVNKGDYRKVKAEIWDIVVGLF